MIKIGCFNLIIFDRVAEVLLLSYIQINLVQ
jgi:hypothetical protein